jgi:hypothetical protein
MPQLPTVPHDSDAEEIIIGNCLLAESLDPLADLGEQHFYSKDCQKVLGAMRAVLEAKKPLILPEVVAWLQNHGNSVSPSYVSELTSVPSLSKETLDHYRGRLQDNLEKRLAIAQTAALAVSSSSGASIEDIHDEAQRIVDRTTRRPAGKKEKRIYPDVPKEAIQGPAEMYMLAHTEASEANDSYHIGFFFTAMGMLLGRTIYMMKGRRVYPNLYTVLVGKSGGRKGTAQNFALDFLRAIDDRVHITESIDSREGFIKDAAMAQKDLDDGGYDGELRAALSLEEFRSFIEKSEQKGTKSVVPELCLWYDCPHERCNKSVSNPAKVKEPTLNIFAGTSPSFLENLSLSDIQGGIGNRICWVPGDPKPRKDDPPDPDQSLIAPLKMRVREIIDARRGFGQKRYEFTKEAKARWRHWYQNEFNPGSSDELITILSERDHLTCLKVAMIYAALDTAEYVELVHLNAAIAWVGFLYESRFPIFAGHGLSPRAQVEHKLVEHVRDNHRANGISYRNLQRAMGRIDAESFHRAMKALAPPEADGPLKLALLGKKRWVWLNE